MRAPWRKYETALIDYFRLRGARFRHDLGTGRTFLLAEIFDDDTGQLVEARPVVDFESLARALADEICPAN